MATNFETLELKIAAESAIIAAKAKITPIKEFALNFAEAETAPGTAINVPIYDGTAAAAFVEGTNDYKNGAEASAVTGVDIALNQHIVKTVSVRPEEIMSGTLGAPNQNYFEDVGKVIGRALTKKIVTDTLAKLGTEAVTASATLDVADVTIAALANLRTNVATADMDPEDCVVLLTPEMYAKLLGLLDWQTLGDQEAVRGGYAGGLFGFAAVMQSNELPSGLNGAIVHKSAIAIASRPQKMYFQNGAGEWGTVRDPETGLTFTMVKNQDWTTQRMYMSGSCLYGSALVQAGKIIKIVPTPEP